MEIHEHKHGAVTVLRPEGPLAGDDAEAFRKRLVGVMNASLGRCAVDASAVPYVDSRGLEAMLEASEEMARSGRALKLCGLNETVRQALEITELAPLFEHLADVSAAVRSFL